MFLMECKVTANINFITDYNGYYYNKLAIFREGNASRGGGWGESRVPPPVLIPDNKYYSRNIKKKKSID